MLKKKLFCIVVIGFLILLNSSVRSQTFGFGCLGFFGGYGGVAYQSYKAEGLNQFVKHFNQMNSPTLNDQLQEYYGAVGYRVGINFFRASWGSGFILTAKGYYQSLTRTREAIATTSNDVTNYTFEMDLKNWAVGIDFGYAITTFLSWKIIDGSVHFNNVSLTNTVDSPDGTIVNKYKSDSGVFGYSVGTGIIISIVKDYISLEGLAAYTYLQIEDLKTDDGQFFLKPPPDAAIASVDFGNFIDSGGFTAVVQLNIGFPL